MTAIRLAFWRGAVAILASLAGAACSLPDYSSRQDGGPDTALVDGGDGAAGRAVVDGSFRDGGTPADASTEAQQPWPATCFDNVRGPAETDVDCGGVCAPCGPGKGCSNHSDCQSGSCQNQTCAIATCGDGIRNQDETDLDCGGETCLGCPTGARCATGRDCQSKSCGQNNVCVATTCTDSIRNQDESSVDCGGLACGKCSDGMPCAGPSDCQSGVCVDQLCRAPTCTDGVRNGTETGVDCGGGCASPPASSKCAAREPCLQNVDCIDGVCTDSVCQPSTCSDGTQNESESDTDCGGLCKKCAAGARCQSGLDCSTSVCTNRVCQVASCQDGVQNGLESDTDCGGGLCNRCADGKKCSAASDCQSKVCKGFVCQAPTCSDGAQNGSESDQDCGGVETPRCTRCMAGRTCGQDSDCASGVCGTAGRCADSSCADGVQNGSESSIDCGGPDCDPCDNNKPCVLGSDCRSGSCQGADGGLACQAASCTDAVRNGTETAPDCGGWCTALLPPSQCGPGLSCGSAIDCQSGVCASNVCQAPSCVPKDNVRNGSESDVDCGGDSCPPCSDGNACSKPTDCASGVCQNVRCAVPSCAPPDAVRNGTETDVDCGGQGCPKCPDGDRCGTGADCSSGVCSVGSSGSIATCQAARCPDGVKNQGETDIDCGGSSCTTRCAVGKSCATDADCVSSALCIGGTCRAPSCTDGRKDGNETDLDCGGGCTTKCVVGQSCAQTSDCVSSAFCHSSTLKCITSGCTNNVKDPTETDIDCGGATCAKCANSLACSSGSDCLSAVCSGTPLRCQAPRCSPGDGVKNGSETDTDCGGSGCPKCGDGKACSVASDCASGVCVNAVCQAPKCSPGDNVKNGGETDIDCGGATCSVKCADGKACLLSRDCVNAVCYVSAGVGATARANTCPSGNCTGGLCRNTACNDGLWGGTESDVDCGGSCAKCANAKKCGADTDCSSNVCNLTTKVCQALGCSPGDGRKNGTETDVDCGGGACPLCANGKYCVQRSDCASGGACASGRCQAPTCVDRLQNQSETDVDCGGPNCGKCGDNFGCSIASDCTSGVCTSNRCVSASCTDQVQNNNETDADCGGTQNPLCSRCATNRKCATGGDCASGTCTNNICVPSTLKVQYAHPDDAGPTNGEIKPYLRIVNTGTAAVPYNQLKIRYWFNRDGSSSFIGSCYYFQAGCGSLAMQFYAISPGRTGANEYMELTFTTSASIAAGGNGGEIKLEWNGPSFTPFAETAHWSYNGNMAYSDWNHVTLYRNGTLVWGLEPQ